MRSSPPPACRRFALVALCVSCTTFASEPAERLDTVVVSASGLGLSQTEASPHVDVYTRDDIENDAPASLAAFLQHRAGIVTDRGARSGGFGSLFLRGADPSHVVVLVDGVRQNDPLSSRGSAVDLNTLTLDDVERIEVVRGTGSLLQGEAIAGVVQIFTRAMSAQRSARAAVEAGGDGLRAANAAVGGEAWQVAAAQREDGDRDEVGHSRTRSVDAGAQAQAGETQMSARLRVADSDGIGFPDDSGGVAYAVLRERERRHARSRQLTLGAEHRTERRGTFTATVRAMARDSDESSPGVAPGLRDPFGLPTQTTRGDYTRRELEAAWHAPDFAGWNLLAAVQAQRETATLDSRLFLGAWVPSTFRIDRDTTSLIGEARTTRGPWSVQLGLRAEFASGEDDVRHPAASAQYRLPGDAGRVGASFSSARKLPSFYALGAPFVGNPALKPERARQAEAFYATDERAVVQARVTAFRADYRDLVDFDAGPPPTLINRAHIRSEGVELDLSHALTDAVRIAFNGTAMRVRDPDGGAPLRFRPRRLGGLSLDAALTESLSLHTGATHVGRRFDSAIPTGDRWLGGYTTLDASLVWRRDAWQASVALDNAFDHRYDDAIGTDAGGRRLRVGVAWHY